MKSEMRQLLRSSFLAFSLKAYAAINEGQRLQPHPYLGVLAHRLQKVARHETRRLVVSMPPRHGKSFLGSKCLPAFILAHEPAARIMVLSYGAELAEEIAYDIRQIMRSDFYKGITTTRLAKDRTKVTDFATSAGGRVRAVSIEGGVTGKGGDFIIIDDPVEIKDHDNIKRLERVNELFDGEIRTRLDNPKKGCILIIAHRISEDDLVGHVLREGGWKDLKLPLIAPRARKYDLGNGSTWCRRKGELLRPDAMTVTQVAQLRASTTKPGFETLQQQNPGDEGRLRLKADHFLTFSPTMLRLSHSPVVLSIDPGQKGGPTNSFSVIQAWAVQGNVYMLLNQWRQQAIYTEFRDAARLFIRRYRPSAVVIEATGQGPALSSDIRQQTGMEIVQVSPTENKIDRLRRHSKVIRSGRVRLPEDASWGQGLLSEVVLFPFAEFDDQVDAMTQFLEWISGCPNLEPRPSRAIAAGVNSRGLGLSTCAVAVSSQGLGNIGARGCVVVRAPSIRKLW
jgi:predicted phage terminase large subunit-like protein